MIKIIIFLLVVNFVQAYKHLSLIKSIRIDSSKISKTPNFSGLTTDGTSLYTVSDRGGLHSIYKLISTKNSTTLKVIKYLDFPENFLNDYKKSTQSFRRIDFEGLCFAKDRFYVINETMRDVLSLKLTGQAELIRIPFNSFHKNKMNPFSGVVNAGLEAISCDSQNNKLYLFNERQFRMAYEYDIKTKYITKQFTFPSGNSFPKALKKDGSRWLFADFAGSHYQDGLLYVLVRNRRMIVKYNPKTMKIIERRVYTKFEKPLYDTNEEFGLGEGLTILGDKLYVIFDNNGFALKGTKNDTSSSLLVFKKF
ncbi:MAG: hypothetical protein COB02_15595 [Candidatus Cloacimonadota bacterium]|nr:MAG: hypothetical protein COB02_15595 [Candidatus Cloacimonadota bacterium]